MASKVRPRIENLPVGLKSGVSGLLQVGGILNSLPHLTQQELKAIQVAVENELLKSVDIDKELFGLVFTITGEKPIAISKFASGPNGALWKKNVGSFYELEQKLTGPEHPRQNVRYALRKFLMEILIEDIKAINLFTGLPFNLKQICQHLGKAEAAFDRAFPGYLKNRLGHLIMSKLGG